METWDTPSDWLVGWSAGWLAGVCLARKNQACVLSVDVLHAGPIGEDLRARRERERDGERKALSVFT